MSRVHIQIKHNDDMRVVLRESPVIPPSFATNLGTGMLYLEGGKNACSFALNKIVALCSCVCLYELKAIS